MEWSVYLARFVAGAFLANTLPHVVSGMRGRPLSSPFASPPGKGESSPTVNIVWGTANAVVGYLLLYPVDSFTLARSREVLIVGVGGFLLALMLSKHSVRLTARQRLRAADLTLLPTVGGPASDGPEALPSTGHKTRAVFERDNIVSSGDLRDTARRLDTSASRAAS